MNIAVAPGLTEYFEEVVQDAVQARRVEATGAAIHYLVSLLCDFAHPGEAAERAFDRPLTFQLHDALQASGPERFHRLRTLGDAVLYALGFFGSGLTGRADRAYVLSLGSSAYGHASAMLRLGGSGAEDDVLSELSRKYPRFVEVVAEVADGALAKHHHSNRDLLRLYDRWKKTGSERIGEELVELGLVPTRGPDDLN